MSNELTIEGLQAWVRSTMQGMLEKDAEIARLTAELAQWRDKYDLAIAELVTDFKDHSEELVKQCEYAETELEKCREDAGRLFNLCAHALDNLSDMPITNDWAHAWAHDAQNALDSIRLSGYDRRSP